MTPNTVNHSTLSKRMQLRRILLVTVLALISALSLTFAITSTADAASKHYSICAKTADIWLAGTDSDVEVKLTGTAGSTTWLVLDDSKDNFERGTTDCFGIWSTDVGTLKTVTVWTSGSRNWFLSHIDVNNQVFPHNGWVNSGSTVLKP
jgi:uncharacterized protein YfaQ (DUF2300 family)